jgi:hypothetical protein
MHHDAFQDLSPAICTDIFNRIRHNRITKEYTIIYNTFEYIEQTVDSVDRPNDRNQTLFGLNFCLLFSKTSYRDGTSTAVYEYLK